MNCSNCEIEYNLKNRKPILLTCGDTFCFKCIYKLKKKPEFLCPIDNKVFDKFISFPINQEIFENIQKTLETKKKDSILEIKKLEELQNIEQKEEMITKEEKIESEAKNELNPKTEKSQEQEKIEKTVKNQETVKNHEIEKMKEVQKNKEEEKIKETKKTQIEEKSTNLKKEEEEIKELTMEIINKEMSKITKNYDFNFKLITIGNTFTGKSSLLSRYFKNIFSKTSPTITVDFFTKNLKIDNKSVLFTAYDTAGSESYKSITSKYVRNKHCILFVFDLTKKESFLDIQKWVDFAADLKRNDALCVLVGNKSDLEGREVDTKEALDFAKRMKMGYFEVSSKNCENVDKLFKYCAVRSYKRFFKERQINDVEEFRVFNKKVVKKGCFDWFLKIFIK